MTANTSPKHLPKSRAYAKAGSNPFLNPSVNPTKRSLAVSAYLCGPMTGCVNFNYPNFHEAARRLRDQGWDVESPAENTPPQDGTWESYMRIAVQQMLTCDCVIVMPGWQASTGANLELAIAHALNMPAYYDEPAVRDLKPQRTDTIKYWLSQLLDGVVSPKLTGWLKA
jgi:Domain of unknown function (DUF4406)